MYSYEDTYSTPEFANVRYPSSAKESVGGWAYVFTQDFGYVTALSANHAVQVKLDGTWVPFTGELPTSDDTPEIHGDEKDQDSED